MTNATTNNAPSPTVPVPEASLPDALDLAISRILTAGLALACAVSLLGGILMLINAPPTPPDLSTFHAEPAALRSIPTIITGAARLDPPSVALLGVLLLIATTIARVALALAIFAKQRDRLYVVVSLLLLAVLIASLLARP